MNRTKHVLGAPVPRRRRQLLFAEESYVQPVDHQKGNKMTRQDDRNQAQGKAKYHKKNRVKQQKQCRVCERLPTW